MTLVGCSGVFSAGNGSSCFFAALVRGRRSPFGSVSATSSDRRGFFEGGSLAATACGVSFGTAGSSACCWRALRAAKAAKALSGARKRQTCELYIGIAVHGDMKLTTCLLFLGFSLHCMQLTAVRIREKTTVLIMRSKADKQKKLACGPCSRGAEKKDRPFNSNILTQRQLLPNCGFAIIIPGKNFLTPSLNWHRGTWLRQHSAHPLRKHHRSSLCPIP